eukprot:8165885-Alexandrium_andersonii.AAC.1
MRACSTTCLFVIEQNRLWSLSRGATAHPDLPRLAPSAQVASPRGANWGTVLIQIPFCSTKNIL